MASQNGGKFADAIEELKKFGPLLAWLACMTALGMFAAYPSIHKPGQFGIFETCFGIGVAAFLLLALALSVAVIVAAWKALAKQQRAWPAKFFIPAVIALALLTSRYVVNGIHFTTFQIWKATPLGISYSDMLDVYQHRCMAKTIDQDGSSHYDDDWHSGAYACRPMARRLANLYPSPAWFFGADLKYEPSTSL